MTSELIVQNHKFVIAFIFYICFAMNTKKKDDLQEKLEEVQTQQNDKKYQELELKIEQLEKEKKE
ncbi:MAG: hypothetical protein L0Y61_09425, partial [Epsilonproteobacteria bacterium]|nr:hypothetical protein [Campylobacterota bacterium]